MATKTTRYSPDTCECVIEYTWDDTLPASSRNHTLSNYVTKCSAHSALTNTGGWNAIFEENPRKNETLKLVLDNGPTILYDSVGGGRQLKANVNFDFSWTGTAPNRVLNISITGVSLTTQQKNTIQSVLNTRFGTGRVLIS